MKPFDNLPKVDSVLLCQIGLVEQNHRSRTTLSRYNQVALDAPLVVVPIKPAHDKERVDICGEHLLVHCAARLFSRQHAFAIEHLLDDRRIRPQSYPIPHCRPSRTVSTHLSAHAGFNFAVFCPHQEALARC